MERYGIIKSFSHAVEKLKYEEIMKFFSSNAFIHSPVYGKKAATSFYKDLIEDSKHVKIEVKHIYQSLDSAHSLAALIVFTWNFIDGSSIHEECINLFEFSPNSEKIDTLTIIYDASQARMIKEKLHQKT